MMSFWSRDARRLIADRHSSSLDLTSGGRVDPLMGGQRDWSHSNSQSAPLFGLKLRPLTSPSAVELSSGPAPTMGVQVRRGGGVQSAVGS